MRLSSRRKAKHPETNDPRGADQMSGGRIDDRQNVRNARGVGLPRRSSSVEESSNPAVNPFPELVVHVGFPHIREEIGEIFNLQSLGVMRLLSAVGEQLVSPQIQARDIGIRVSESISDGLLFCRGQEFLRLYLVCLTSAPLGQFEVIA